ncbi:MAG: barstar family protein [Planctomycetes bacterium]|nr:barstar family protein [Planctomycetota bacterium]
MADKPVYVIDGTNFGDFAGFIEECNRGFIRAFGGDWNGNLDAFNDYFYWGDGDYVLVWKNSGKSRTDLGHAAMADWLDGNSRRCHPLNVQSVLQRREAARHGHGPTFFDWLIEIIREQLNVELRLE